MSLNNSKLYLVGAGPGDEDLITLKAIKALEKADVVLYDALANENLLKYCKISAEKVFVGKRAGLHHYSQFLINKMIVRYGQINKHVVRLKGGDPFVFGRGYEELEYAEKHGMSVEVIPGISSPLSVPALQKIPVTHRGASESFWVVTGTTKEGEFSNDLPLAAQSSATVMVLMGMKKLHEIVDLFKEYRGDNEHIGIIQHGSTTHEKTAFGRLSNIENLVKQRGLDSPAIIIIGQVVGLKEQSSHKGLEEFVFDEYRLDLTELPL